MSIQDEFEEMRRTINRMLKDAFDGKLGVFREPFVYGFTMRTRDARGEGTFQAVEGQEVVSKDPIVDVILNPDSIFVTAELPGARDEDVHVAVEGTRLTIEADGDKHYYTSVELPSDIDASSLQPSFTNGVLDITLKRVRPGPST